MKSIHIVVGARPNYIKANPVYRALEVNPHYSLKLIHTGQHYDHVMSALFFDQLKMKSPDISLKVGSGSHGAQTALILERYEDVLLEDKPDLVMVFGDVNSTIACSLAAVKLHIPVAHVEAGLRSFDRTMPEEINRVLTDRIADFLFTTSPEARENLTKEGVAAEKVHFVGNTMIDSLVAFNSTFDSAAIRKTLSIPDAFALLTFHRPSNVDQEPSLKALAEAVIEVAETLACVFPVHPRTRHKLREFGLLKKLESNPAIILTDPIGYIDFMHLQKNAAVVLTDSGGVQEETTYFGVPCLTVRDNTERPITCTRGTNKLIGTAYTNIPGEVLAALHKPRRSQDRPELWDGHAAERLAEVINRRL